MKKNFCLSSFVLFLVSVGFGRGFQDLEPQPQKVSISRKFVHASFYWKLKSEFLAFDQLSSLKVMANGQKTTFGYFVFYTKLFGYIR